MRRSLQSLHSEIRLRYHGRLDMVQELLAAGASKEMRCLTSDDIRYHLLKSIPISSYQIGSYDINSYLAYDLDLCSCHPIYCHRV